MLASLFGRRAKEEEDSDANEGLAGGSIEMTESSIRPD